MTPREKVVLKAIIIALNRGSKEDVDGMDAFATSLPVHPDYSKRGIREKAAYLLEALIEGIE